MSTIVDYELRSEDWVLSDLANESTVHVDSLVSADERVQVYLWTDAKRGLVASRRLGSKTGVENVESVDSTGDRTMVRVDRPATAEGPLASLTGYEAGLLEAVGVETTFVFRVRFPDVETFESFRRDCRRHGTPVTPVRVRTPTETQIASELSPAQRAALTTAYEEGYFAVPRGTTLVELSDELGVSDTAVSQRLRRGIGRLVEATIADRAEEPKS